MSFIYTADIAEKPKHLDLEFFTDTLENALLKTNFEIQKIEFSMGSKAGENYCSQIYRTSISYKLTDCETVKKLFVILKSMPISEVTDFLQDLEVFHKEKIFYSRVLPLMQLLLEKEEKFGPSLYHSLKTPINTLAFEDLLQLNYKLASREKGLDEYHARLVMRKLGKFHACSRKVFEKNTELLESFKFGMISEESTKRDDGLILNLFGNNLKALINFIQDWPGYEDITNKIRKYANNFKANLLRSGKPQPDEFKVLNHGDLWVNNILFKYNDKGKPEDLTFLDFQLSVYTSPGIDLNYFFYSSLELEVLKCKRDELIKEYFIALQEDMLEMNLMGIPSYEHIYNEVQGRLLYGFFTVYGELPMICMDKKHSDDSSFESLVSEDMAQKKIQQMFSSKRLVDTMRYTLRDFDKMHIFD